MHIRLLLMTFFLQFFPDLVKHEKVYVLETPLFRVRNKQETIYCYSEEEKQAAVKKLGSKPEITRFKGLGEISPDEFARFIGTDMKLQPVMLLPETHIQELLEYYMGKNTMERQEFIIENLKIELDKVEEDFEVFSLIISILKLIKLSCIILCFLTNNAKLDIIRKSKSLFMKWKLHGIFEPFTRIFFECLSMSKLSKWRSKQK
jgi:hypothetical protein